MGSTCTAPVDLVSLADVWIRLNALPTEGLWLARGQGRPWSSVEARLLAPIQTYATWAEGAGAPQRAAAELCQRALRQGLEVGARLASQASPLCFCRSDPRFANVIARPDGRLGLVDWEDSGLRDPAREVADLFMHPNQEDLIGKDARAAFLARYVPEQTGDAGFEARLREYLAVFGVFWIGQILNEVLPRARNGTADGALINDVDATQRMRRYLGRCEVWPELDFETKLAELAELRFF